jgi:ABC-type transport system substrate-binding protein
MDAAGPPAAPSPHPILSDVQVRRAIAYCTDKDAIVAAVYPALTPAEREDLIMDTFIHPDSWAYTAPTTSYPYNPATGNSLLDAAGWTLPPSETYRTKDGKELALVLTTSDSPERHAIVSEFATQMEACGIRVLPNHQPASWMFADDTGVFVRDFEAGEYAWHFTGDDPGGEWMYACDKIPTPTNNWAGLNYVGWCNTAASSAIEQASDTNLSQTEREGYYATFLELHAQDVPQLPLYMRPGGTVDDYTWEHIDLALETFSQGVTAEPASQSVLDFTDFHGHTGTVTIPTGAVTETMTLAYAPLYGTVWPPRWECMGTATEFRLTASVAGVPQREYTFDGPIAVSVSYGRGRFYDLVDDTLALYYWDGAEWQDAYMSCAEPDRYQHHDVDNDRFEVHVCHLSEFSLMGRHQGSVCPRPDPILGDVRVRRAIAHCTDKDAIVSAVYPLLTPPEREELILDTPIHPDSWAYTAPSTSYPYNPAAGIALLEAAGWTLPGGGQVREKDGKPLVLTASANDSPTRVTILTAFAAQMEACGIRMLTDHSPNSWFFGYRTGIFARDFELCEFAWGSSGTDPSMDELYACDQMPQLENGWQGYNIMGWCNHEASEAINKASNSDASQEEREPQFATFLEHYAQDVPQIPLYMREGATLNSYTWEHIDLNLETWSEEEEVPPGEETVLNFDGYEAFTGTVTIPSGAVPETVTLRYDPLAGTDYGAPGFGLDSANHFRLTVWVDGLPQESYSFLEPVRVRMNYWDWLVGKLYEETLALHYWDGDEWQEASATCGGGDFYEHLDTDAKFYEVNVCHLSEFVFAGVRKPDIFLPLVMR